MPMQVWKEWVPKEDIYDLMIAKSTTIFNSQLILAFEKQDAQKVKIHFKEGFLSLRESDEFCYDKSTEELNDYFKKIKLTKSAPWFLFTIENSNYVKSFQKETFGIYNFANIQHFVIFSDDINIEVLSLNKPQIEISYGE